MKNFRELRQNFRQSMGEELEIMHSFNEDIFESSSEGSYWRRRSNRTTKKTESYQRFKVKRNYGRTAKKKRNFGDQYKKSKKWYGYDEKYYDYETFRYVTRENEGRFGLKNRVFCRFCNKTKFIFTSKKKADNYILYNGETIRRLNGYSPIRSYYCSACGGWHTTHLELLPTEEVQVIFSEGSLLYEGLQRENWEEGTDFTVEEENLNEELTREVAEEVSEVNETEVNVTEEENISKDDEVLRLVSEIAKIFEGQMAEFNQALECRNVKECKRLSGRLRRIFSSLDIRCEAMAPFFERLDRMSDQIKELEQQIKDQEEKVKKEIWNIQKIFRAQMDLFTTKFGIGRYDECWTIFNHLSDAINSFPKNMHFLKEFRKKLQTMEARLCSCGYIVRASA